MSSGTEDQPLVGQEQVLNAPLQNGQDLSLHLDHTILSLRQPTDRRGARRMRNAPAQRTWFRYVSGQLPRTPARGAGSLGSVDWTRAASASEPPTCCSLSVESVETPRSVCSRKVFNQPGGKKVRGGGVSQGMLTRATKGQWKTKRPVQNIRRKM